jgi:hypothetical protein
MKEKLKKNGTKSSFKALKYDIIWILFIFISLFSFTDESLSGLESIETSCDTQAQNVLQPFPNDTGGSSAQQPKLKCDNLLAVSKKRNDSKLMNDRNDDGKMCDQYEDTRAVLPTRSSDNNRIRRTRRYSKFRTIELIYFLHFYDLQSVNLNMEQG